MFDVNKYYRDRWHNDPEFKKKRSNHMNKYINERRKIDEEFRLRTNLHAKITMKKIRVTKREQLFEILGGAICKHCGFSDKRCLQFDHKNGDARKDRDRGLYGSKLIIYYSNHPDEARQKLQVLCANCNWIKRSIMKEVRK